MRDPAPDAAAVHSHFLIPPGARPAVTRCASIGGGDRRAGGAGRSRRHLGLGRHARAEQARTSLPSGSSRQFVEHQRPARALNLASSAPRQTAATLMRRTPATGREITVVTTRVVGYYAGLLRPGGNWSGRVAPGDRGRAFRLVGSPPRPPRRRRRQQRSRKAMNLARTTGRPKHRRAGFSQRCWQGG